MSKRPESIKKVLAALLALTLFLYLPGATVGARTLEEIQQDLNNATQRKAADEAQQKTLAQQLADTENRLHALELDIGILQDQLTVVQTSRVDAEKSLLKIEARLAVAEDQLAAQNDLIDTRLSGIYKQGDTGYLDVILGASSFDDFVSRMTYLSMIIKSDARVMQKCKAARDQVQADRDLADSKKQDILSQERAIQAIKAPLDRKNEEIVAEKNNKESLLTALKNDVAAQDAVIADARKQQQEAANRRVGGGERPGYFSTWPAGDASFAAGIMGDGSLDAMRKYGYRYHPIYGDIRFHYGIDISVDEGVPVVSPTAGTVIYTGWNDVVGNTVEIDHGGGVKTRYCHLHTGSISVFEGNYLAAGQQFARVGNTGSSTTGAHLHFEVYDYALSNDDPVGPYNTYNRAYTVNPLGWLP